MLVSDMLTEISVHLEALGTNGTGIGTRLVQVELDVDNEAIFSKELFITMATSELIIFLVDIRIHHVTILSR